MSADLLATGLVCDCGHILIRRDALYHCPACWVDLTWAQRVRAVLHPPSFGRRPPTPGERVAA